MKAAPKLFPLHYDEQSIFKWEFSVVAVGATRKCLCGSGNGGAEHAFLFIMLIKSLKFSRNNLPTDEKNFLAPDTVT